MGGAKCKSGQGFLLALLLHAGLLAGWLRSLSMGSDLLLAPARTRQVQKRFGFPENSVELFAERVELLGSRAVLSSHHPLKRQIWVG